MPHFNMTRIHEACIAARYHYVWHVQLAASHASIVYTGTRNPDEFSRVVCCWARRNFRKLMPTVYWIRDRGPELVIDDLL